MFLKIEDGSLVNVTLVDRVIFNHQQHKRTALLYQGGQCLCGDSRIAYEYFTDPKNFGFLMVPEPAAPESPAIASLAVENPADVQA